MSELLTAEGYEQTKEKLRDLQSRLAEIKKRTDLAPAHLASVRRSCNSMIRVICKRSSFTKSSRPSRTRRRQLEHWMQAGKCGKSAGGMTKSAEHHSSEPSGSTHPHKPKTASASALEPRTSSNRRIASAWCLGRMRHPWSVKSSRASTTIDPRIAMHADIVKISG